MSIHQSSCLCGVFAALLMPLVTFATQNPSTQPTNAAELYRRAFELLPDDLHDSAILEDPVTAPLDEHAQELVKRCEQSLALMRQGSTVRNCDWGIDYSPGPLTMLPHLQPSRLLAAVAVLQARLDFEHQQPAAAVATLLATMQMARQVGQEPLIICRLIQCGVEDKAVTVLAEQLPRLPKDTLNSLTAGLKNLPAAKAPSEAVRNESRVICDWITNTEEPPEELLGNLPNANEIQQLWADPAARAAAAKSLQELFDEAASLLDLPTDDWGPAFAQWQDKIDGLDPITGIFPPNLGYLREGTGKCAARMAMFEAAITIVQDGPDAAKKTRDPFDDGPFGYVNHDGGFTLSSSATVRGEPVTLRVGK